MTWKTEVKVYALSYCGVTFLYTINCCVCMYIHIPEKKNHDKDILYTHFLFSFESSMSVDKLEPEAQEAIRKKAGQAIKTVYFNKGL